MSHAELGVGDVPVTIDGEQLVFRPTLHAVKILSQQGGLAGMIQRCSVLDFDAILMVTIAGLGLTGNGSKDLPEKIYRTGLFRMSAACIKFINVLANGGRPPGEQKEDPLQAS